MPTRSIQIMLVLVTLSFIIPQSLWSTAPVEPIAYWRFDGNADDSVSPARKVNIPEELSFVGSYVGLGLKFPGGGIHPQNKENRLTFTHACTVEAWILIQDGSSGSCLIYANGDSYALGIEDGQPFLTQKQRKWVPKEARLETGKWYFLAASFNGRRARLFINGKETSLNQHEGTMESGSQITIGRCTQPFNGILDEVKLFSQALSADMIMEHFKAVPKVVAIWSFDGNMKDKSGYGHHGKRINGASFTKGRINDCLYLDGNNDYGIFSNKSQLLDPRMNMSIEAWIYLYSIQTPQQHIYDKYRSMTLSVKDGKLAMGGRGGWWYPENTDLKIKRWYHVVGTYSLMEMKLYINGKLMNSRPIFISAAYGDVVYVGSPYFPFHGLIDEMKLYGDTLSEAEVYSRFQAK